MVGLGVDFGDAPDYVRHNDLGTAVLLRRAGPAALRRPPRAGQQHGRLRRGPLPLRRARRGEPRTTARRGSRGGALRGTLRRSARDRWLPRRSARPGAWTPATSTPPPSSIRSTCAPPSLASPAATVISLRYHNVYGPRMPRDTPYAGVASIFASSLSAGQSPRVFEDGGQLRDFVHVRDVARANVQALCADGRDARSVQRGQRAATLSSRDGRRRWLTPTVTGRRVRSSPASTGWAMSAMSSPPPRRPVKALASLPRRSSSRAWRSSPALAYGRRRDRRRAAGHRQDSTSRAAARLVCARRAPRHRPPSWPRRPSRTRWMSSMPWTRPARSWSSTARPSVGDGPAGRSSLSGAMGWPSGWPTPSPTSTSRRCSSAWTPRS